MLSSWFAKDSLIQMLLCCFKAFGIATMQVIHLSSHNVLLGVVCYFFSNGAGFVGSNYKADDNARNIHCPWYRTCG